MLICGMDFQAVEASDGLEIRKESLMLKQ